MDARLGEAINLLKKIEWTYAGGEVSRCLFCGQFRTKIDERPSGHAEDCELAKLLKDCETQLKHSAG